MKFLSLIILHFSVLILSNTQMHWTDQQNPNTTSNFQSVNSLNEFPQPFLGSVCNLMEFNTYLSKQISSHIIVEAQGCFSLDNKVILDIEINKLGEVNALVENLDNIKIKIPKFETPALINSNPVNLKHKIPLHICLK